MALRLSAGQFALAASAADVLPRIHELIAGRDPSGLGERRLPLQGGFTTRQDLDVRKTMGLLTYLTNL